MPSFSARRGHHRERDSCWCGLMLATRIPHEFTVSPQDVSLHSRQSLQRRPLRSRPPGLRAIVRKFLLEDRTTPREPRTAYVAPCSTNAGVHMATYITLLKFTEQGLKTIKEGPSRLERAKQLARSMGGRRSSRSTSYRAATTPSSSRTRRATKWSRGSRWPSVLWATSTPRRCERSPRTSTARWSPHCREPNWRRRLMGCSSAEWSIGTELCCPAKA